MELGPKTWSTNLLRKSIQKLSTESSPTVARLYKTNTDQLFGPTFEPTFEARIRHRFWGQVLDPRVGSISEPKFLEIAKKNPARHDRTTQPKQKNHRAPESESQSGAELRAHTFLET